MVDLTKSDSGYKELVMAPRKESNSNSLNSLNSSVSLDSTVLQSTENVHSIEVEMLRSMFRLHVTDVHKTEQCKDLMNYLRKISSNNTNSETKSDICYIVDNDNCMEFFKNYIINVNENVGHMLEHIAQRQYINFIKLVMSLWNMSDKFGTLCARMAAFNIHTYLIRFLGKIYLSPRLLHSKQLQLMVMSIVGILHNINDKLQYTRSRYRDENLVEYLMPLASLKITKELIGLKTAALLLLAFLVNENENCSLNANDDHIIYILGILKDTLESAQLYSLIYGYHCLEILQSLRHIASPDSNKESLINHGILSFIEIVLKPEYETKYEKELIAGLELLWSLSFSQDCLLVLGAVDCDLKTRVQVLSENPNKNIMLSARGILWNINAQRTLSIKNLIVHDSKTPNINGHIMISYQHSTQEIMIKIKDALVSCNYKVWMDVDHMRGSFVDAMADGIQHASVLLLGMCQAFKNSPHCRQEVKYAYTLGIPLIPIMLEPGFTPDGWLGLMCATLSHTDFIDANEFDNSIEELEKQLGTLGKVSTTVNDSANGLSYLTINSSNSKHYQNELIHDSLSSHQIDINLMDSVSDILISFKSDHSTSLNVFNQINNVSERPKEIVYRLDSNLSLVECNPCGSNGAEAPTIIKSRFQVVSWSRSQCKSWLIENNLQPDNHPYLRQLDGSLLYELAEMRITAPKSYFTSVKEELKLDFISFLHLNRALRNLDQFP